MTTPTLTQSGPVTLTQSELLEEAQRRFGPDRRQFAFQCPSCGDVATLQDFIDAGDEHAARAGQDCIGRLTGALTKPTPTNTRGCDWAAYGLFRGPWSIVLPAEGDKPERKVPSFPLAPATTRGADQ